MSPRSHAKKFLGHAVYEWQLWLKSSKDGVVKTLNQSQLFVLNPHETCSVCKVIVQVHHKTINTKTKSDRFSLIERAKPLSVSVKMYIENRLLNRNWKHLQNLSLILISFNRILS